ncbi:MAG TPA: hypothetical protein VMV99_10650 [Rhodanobacter sp.]|nr:hypothetical protein [Rhodanobacter sp.]
MKRIIAACVMVVASISCLPAFAFCPQRPAGANNDSAAYFQATTLAMRQMQLGADAALTVSSTAATPFDVVYGFKSNLADTECAESAIAPFAGSSNKNIAQSATLMLSSLRVLHAGGERALDRINASLGSAPPSQAQMVNESADDALTMKDAIDNLFLSTTMSAMLIKTCDPGAPLCLRLSLTDHERNALSGQWDVIAKDHAADRFARYADGIVKFLREPKFLSTPVLQETKHSQ